MGKVLACLVLCLLAVFVCLVMEKETGCCPGRTILFGLSFS